MIGAASGGGVAVVCWWSMVHTHCKNSAFRQMAEGIVSRPGGAEGLSGTIPQSASLPAPFTQGGLEKPINAISASTAAVAPGRGDSGAESVLQGAVDGQMFKFPPREYAYNTTQNFWQPQKGILKTAGFKLIFGDFCSATKVTPTRPPAGGCAGARLSRKAATKCPWGATEHSEALGAELRQRGERLANATNANAPLSTDKIKAATRQSPSQLR